MPTNTDDDFGARLRALREPLRMPQCPYLQWPVFTHHAVAADLSKCALSSENGLNVFQFFNG